jgi:hypothetical protein
MTIDEREDLLTRSLKRLPRLSPDEARAEQLRKRCRAAIGRLHLAGGYRPVSGLAIEAAFLGVLCAGYLLAVALEVLRLYAIH